MDRFFDILRKVLVGTVVTIFTFVVTYTPQQYNEIHVANANLAVFDAANFGVNADTAVQTTIAAVKETSLDGIALIVAKTMISQILRSMVTWINSGFKGSPAFIQDLERFLLDVADEAAGEYIRTLGDIGSFICAPFRLDIQLALALKYQKAREGRDIDSCTLSGVVDNVERFFNNQVDRRDFWKQWVEVTSKPQTYTPYGQFMAAETELNNRIVNARGREIQIANWGEGFLSSEVCEAIEGPTTASPAGTTTAAAPANQKQRCVISTPGKVISEQINKALGAGQDSLVAADEINEVISALLGQIANQALTGAAGLLGLNVRSGGSAGGTGSYVDELVRDSYNQSGSFLEQNYNQIKDKLEVQKDYNEMAVFYIPKLREVIDAPVTALRFRGLTTTEIEDLKNRAQISYSDALEVRANTIIHIARLEPIVTELERLQREYLDAATTEARKQEIISLQTKLVGEGAQYQAYTLTRFRISAREWGDITDA